MPKHRAETAADRMRDFWVQRSERNKIKYAAFVKDHCVEYADGLDGFVIHATTCPDYQDTAVSGSRCINFTYNTGFWPVGLAEVRNGNT